MHIEIADFTDGARQARGVAIVIDVFRACSLAAYAIDAGVQSILPVAGISDALAARAARPDALLAGERHAQPFEGADCGNSPTLLLQQPLAGRSLIHCTHAGTQGLTGATQATHVFTGALVNATATVRAVLALAPAQVTIIRMGLEARERCAEDDICAELLAWRFSAGTDAALEPQFRADAVRAKLRGCSAAQKFFDAAADWAPLRDFELCTAVDRFDFAVALSSASSPPSLRRWPFVRQGSAP